MKGESCKSHFLNKQWNDYDFSGDENIRPTVENYNVAIRAWGDVKNPKEAERILFSLIQQSKRLELQALRPNTESYSLLIRAWLALAQRGSEAALSKAAKWMDTLSQCEKEEKGVLTSVELYLAFLGAARQCAPHAPAVVSQLARDQFEKLRDSRHPLEPQHYARMVQITIYALSKESDNERRRIALYKFINDCKEDGLVSNRLLRALLDSPIYKTGWTIEESRYMMSECFPHFPFPVSWTRNVRQYKLIPVERDLIRRMPTRRG